MDRFLIKHLLSVEASPFGAGLLSKLDRRICHPERYIQAANLLVTNILIYGNVRVSKSNNFYSIPNRYKPEYFARTYVLTMLNLLVKLGYVNELKGFYNRTTGTGKRTIISPTEKLIDEFDTLTIGRNKPKEVIELRDSNKKLIDYQETDLIKRMRNETHSINEAIGNVKIDFLLPINKLKNAATFNSLSIFTPFTLFPYPTLPLITNPKEYISTRNTHPLHALRQSLKKIRIQSIFTGFKRVFNNGNFNCGGRFYDVGFFSYQTLKSELRGLILIEGTPVIELDFGNMFPLMLYHKQGLNFEGDVYQIEGYKRSDVKLALNVMLNAKSKDSTLKRLRLDGVDNPKELLFAIEYKHEPLIKYLYSGVAVELMKIESEILTDILLTMIAEDIIPLPIHDSLLVKDLVKETKTLNGVMINSYKKKFEFVPVIKNKVYHRN